VHVREVRVAVEQCFGVDAGQDDCVGHDLSVDLGPDPGPGGDVAGGQGRGEQGVHHRVIELFDIVVPGGADGGASGQVVEYDVVGPIDVRFANRRAVCSAFVLPGDSESLLGMIPMEEMDVLVHPKRQELVVNPQHPYYAVLKMK